jgi:hypothetical protein
VSLAGEFYCHRCACVTRWELVRGGQRAACAGCGDVFPCRHACMHLDCAAERGERPPRVNKRGAALAVALLLALAGCTEPEPCEPDAGADASGICGIGTPFECDAGAPADAGEPDACITLPGRPPCCHDAPDASPPYCI